MIDDSQLNHLKNLIVSAQNIIIVIGVEASFDQSAAGLALAQVLSATRRENDQLTANPGLESGSDAQEKPVADSNHHKQIRLASPKPRLDTPQLTGLDMMSQELGHQSLTISFEYSEEKVDKISYHIGEEAGKFYLTVKPKVGVEPLDPKTVEYSLTGAEADLLILFGVSELDKLNQLYFGYEELYRNTPLVSFHVFETDFGTVKIDTSTFSSTAEAVYELLSHLGLDTSSDVATNLLAGIEQATNCFQSRTTNAETFAVVADLLKKGARRVVKPQARLGTSNGNLSGSLSQPIGETVPNKTAPLVMGKLTPIKSELSGDLELGQAKVKKPSKDKSPTSLMGGRKFR
ncbi:MAG: hypothetical protein ABIJ03_01840 [Patescibacteria group bacterium]|nr:hypothetical protein [Patescibacteria group bacterium]